MKKYLIDVNLPYHFKHWYGDKYIHQREIDSRMSDKDIWSYAVENNLTIVTKDADFADRIINQSPPPRIIHFKVGNMKLKSFYDFVSKYWNSITNLSKHNKLVNVYRDRLDGIE